MGRSQPVYSSTSWWAFVLCLGRTEAVNSGSRVFAWTCWVQWGCHTVFRGGHTGLHLHPNV